ncbi:MAG: hypothetical protein EU548_06580 [Promethearchaeota archaeon]|nr:MAG: hypothetical protein EU548_06580 [Candidatus Lokiarchaeota archaeon]
MPLLDELWIFSQAGVPIAEFSKKGAVDKTFLGFFISAIKTFSQKVSGREFKGFNIGKNKYSCIHCMDDEIVLVCRSPLDVNRKQIKKICKVIGKMFEDLFTKKDLDNWNGDLSFFDDFQHRLDLYFKMGDL